MAHDAYTANLLRLQVISHLDALRFDQALIAAQTAIAYPAASLPPHPLAGHRTLDAQALYDWAEGLAVRGLVYQETNDLAESLKDFDDAEKAMARILQEFPMKENYSALALILHNRSGTRLKVPDLLGAGRDATQAILIRRKLAVGDPQEADLLAGSLKARANVFLLVGNTAFALQDAVEAVAMRRSALPTAPDPHQRRTFAMTLYTLAQMQAVCGKSTEACHSVREAQAILTELLKRGSSPIVERELATCRELEGRVCSRN